MLIPDARSRAPAIRAERRAMWRVLLTLALIALAAIAVWTASYRLFLIDVRERAADALQYHEETLGSYLEKSRFVAPMLARHPNIERALARDSGESERAELQQLIDSAAAMSGAERVDLWRPDGQRIVTSLAGADLSPADFPTGADAFATAKQGRLGRALFVSSVDAAPSYLFAAPVRDANRITGIVTIRVSLDPIQQAWALSADPLIALVQRDRIVLANRNDWRLDQGGRMTPPSARERDRFVQVSRPIALLSAQLYLVSNTNSASARATSAALATALLLVLLVSAAWMTRERGARLLRQMRSERQMARRLEHRVAQRTAELTESNDKLAQQIAVREATELQLRHAQDELVQAARLATLGQLSAAIGHEFNQPLAAIRSYAENAQAFLSRERAQAASENLERIIALVDRMGELSQHLRLFARQGSADIAPIPLGPAVDGALLLLEPLQRQRPVRLHVERAAPDPVVLAGAIRLEQVIVNLLTNAIDAVEGVREPSVWLRIAADANGASITVCDNGPGIDAELRARVFDPFVTTKPAGRGLGLGLAIAFKIVRDFGGTISVGERAGGGASFTVKLPHADASGTALRNDESDR